MKFYLLVVFSFCCNYVLAAPPQMRLPQDIQLSGLERRVSLSSGLGRIELRWTRESERLFGKTPERATIEAANAVAKALRQSSFPSRVKYLEPVWNIIFLSKDLKEGQVPSALLSSCHPGWMTPPANIYIASEQAAGSCGGGASAHGNVADSLLARVLIHEIGHAVEYALAPNVQFDRVRAEGFATWFEVFAGRYSGMLDSAAIFSQQKLLAKQRSQQNFQGFQGGADDYALAASFFHVLTEDKSVSDLSRVYETMAKEGIPFISAIFKVKGYTEKQLESKITSFLAG